MHGSWLTNTNGWVRAQPRQPKKHLIGTSCGELKATFGTGLVCNVVQQGKQCNLRIVAMTIACDTDVYASCVSVAVWPPPRGLRPTVGCQRYRPKESMGAEAARQSMGTKSVCFLYTLVHLKGLVKWFSPCGHAQEGRGYVAPREVRGYVAIAQNWALDTAGATRCNVTYYSMFCAPDRAR